MHKNNPKYRSSGGFTLIEVMIALLITGIIAAATFGFYVTMHNNVVTQQEVSEMQQICRNSLDEIATSLRMAGYKLDGHAPYRVSGDSLFIFFSATQPVDTVLYYLEEFTDVDYANSPKVPKGMTLWKLMKKVNSNPAACFSEYVCGLRYNVIDSATVAITMAVQTSRSDATYGKNSGFREFSNTERISIRNVGM